MTRPIVIGDDGVRRVGNIDADKAPLLPSDAVQRRILSELYSFTDWCSTYGVKGYVGEFGIPATGPDLSKWLSALDVYYNGLDESGVHSAQWSAGRGWGTNYELATYVNGVSNGDVDTAMESAKVLEAHPPRWGIRRSVALSGFEFPVSGSGANGIRDGGYYALHTVNDFKYLASRGVRSVRLGMAWERMQPTLNTALNATALTNLNTFLQAAAASRITVELDLHNYGRYTNSSNQVLLITDSGGTINAAELADFWTRLSTWIRADAIRNRVVYKYGIMNEPHDLASGSFQVGSTLYDFSASVGAWTGSPTRTTNIFPDGAATFSIGTGGGEYHSNTAQGNLAQYGDTLRMVFQAEPLSTGYFSMNPRLQRASGNSTGADFSTATSGDYFNISSSTPTIVDWTPPAGTLNATRWVGFYAGGAGRVANVNAYLDRVQVGSGLSPVKTWESISQTVVSALRSAGDKRRISVAGYNWSHLHSWTDTHAAPWITDTNVEYEAHHYWDATGGQARSGTYQDPYATVLAAAETAGF